MALNPTAVFDIAEAVLDSVVTRMTAAGVSLPGRQYVHAGEVALDCEQVVVSGMALDHVIPGGSAGITNCVPPRSVNLDVWVVRCVPKQADDGTPPSAADLQTAAQHVLTDLWVLPWVLWQGYEAADWVSRCHNLILQAAVVHGPEGGFSSSVQSLQVQML